MKLIIKRVLPVTLAMSLAAVPVTGHAAELKPGPGMPYSPEVMAKLEDNVMEYGEIEMLIDTYNSTMKNLRANYSENKDSMKDVNKVKEQIYGGSEMLLDYSNVLSNQAVQMESMIGFQLPSYMGGISVTPSAYAACVYNAVLMENKAEQMLLSADQMTAMTSEMMKIQILDSPRALMISGAQSLLIAYENIRIQKESLLDTIALAEAGVQTTERLAAVGMGTLAEVNGAKQGLSAAKAGLITLEANEVNIRQQLCNMLGWAYDANPEIPAIPSVDLSVVDAMNLEADIKTATDNNFTLKYNRLSEETLNAGSVQMENLHRTIEAEKTEIATSITKLYHAVLQARTELFNSQTALASELGNKVKADRQWAAGLISKMDHRKAENAYKSAEVNVRVAELNLLQAIETYRWAVKGNLSLGV